MLALLLVLAVLVPAAPAQAAAPFPRIDASGFKLVRGSTFENYGRWVAGLERHAQLAPVGVGAVLGAANRTGRPLCHGTSLAPSLNPRGLCWQDGEDDDLNVWIPQGLTGSGDAYPSGALPDGRRVIAATWHYEGDAFIRVSFLDLATLKYRHVLLVEPISETNFRAVPGHGHGIVWHGDRLLVASGGSVIRVFDLRHVWRMDTAGAAVGLGGNGRYSARYHAFALPQIGAFWYEGGGCASSTGMRPCIATLALDRSSSSLIAAEHTVRGGGRIVRWPLGADGLPAVGPAGYVQATEAFASPVWGMQGAVSRGSSFVISGVCPEYADNIGDGRDYPSCLHRGVGGASTSTWTKAPVNTQNLSYWPGTGQLWVHNEQLRERVVVHIPWPAGA